MVLEGQEGYGLDLGSGEPLRIREERLSTDFVFQKLRVEASRSALRLPSLGLSRAGQSWGRSSLVA